MGISIRPATPSDDGDLQAIERAAGERFREVGLAFVADAEPFSHAELDAFGAAGRSWVATDEPTGEVVGYVVVEVLDGLGHVEQVSVHPAHQGRCIGRALLDRADRWAASLGLARLTLTTYRDVPWNAPLYAHLGFVVLDEGSIGPELRERRAHEAAEGLDPGQRVCMARPVA